MPDDSQKTTTPATSAKPAPQASPQAAQDDLTGKPDNSGLTRRLFGYLRPYWLQASVSAASIILKSLSDVSGPFLLKTAVDLYLNPAEAHSANFLTRHLSADPLTGLWQIVALYLCALLLTLGLEFVQTYLMQWTGQKIMFDLRSEIFRHIQRLHVAFFDRNPVGRLVTRVTSDVDALNEMFTSGVLAIFEDVFTLLFIIVIMLRMSWPLALLTLSVIPGILYATHRFRVSVSNSYRRQRAATAKINSFTQEYVSGMSIVQLFNRERRAYADFSAVNSENKQAWSDAIFAYALYYPVVEWLSSIAIALVLWIGGSSVLHSLHIAPSAAFSTVTLGVLIAFIQYAQRFFRPIQDLSDKYNILLAAVAAGERIFKLLDTPAEIISPSTTIEPDHRSGTIEFRNVWFTYQQLTQDQLQELATLDPSTAPGTWVHSIEWILRGVSFTVPSGETAAIVGHTGAGKTTITALMMRFYEVQHGQVLVDGVDVREQDLSHLRRRFGVVLQDPFLFSGTIAQNIRMGSDWITDADIARAAEEVNLADFIATLPARYNEPVVERGATLSTGQKQLISFARALAHRPGILILDEATSSVDTETEQRITSALARMITGRTSVLIAHRLSTVQRADTILVMHKGQLREQGSHQELLAHRGLYFKLYELQYKDQEPA